jgi:hypothetical protein
MVKRWQTCTDNTSWDRTVTVENGNRATIREQRDLESGQIFFRKKLTKALEFAGDDFTYFYGFERVASRRCELIYIRLQFKCGASWVTYWTGTFSAGSGKWNLGACRFEVMPETLDKYSCILEKKDFKQNILLTEQVDAEASLAIDVEFTYSLSDELFAGNGAIYIEDVTAVNSGNNGINSWEHMGSDSFWIGSVTFQGLEVAMGDYSSVTYVGEGTPVDQAHVNSLVNQWIIFSPNGPGGILGVEDELYEFRVYRHTWWRQRFLATCEYGDPVMPAGIDWVLLTDECDTLGYATWVRPPQFTYTGNNRLYGGTYVSGDARPPYEVLDCSSWIYVADDYIAGSRIPLYICYTHEDSNTFELPHSRLIENAGNYIIGRMDCGDMIMRSDFFEWDPYGDAPGYTTGFNYVTGATNQVSNLVILQKTDAINPDATDQATIGEMTFSEFMRMMFTMFRVYWDIDNNGDVRLEHWSYWALQPGMDLTTLDSTIEPQVYTHTSDDIPRIERAKFMEAQGNDFVGKDIRYSGPCIFGDKVQDISPGKITTDITYILTDPTEISKDGFAVLATNLVDGVYVTIIAQGAVSFTTTTNAPLSWANLQRDFWTWDRPFRYGNMNSVDTEFDGYLPNIEQEDVSASLCCDLLRFDPRDYMTTQLGIRIGSPRALVESVDHDIDQDVSKFILRYAL